jgi:myo-inositol 2-dehydrogenase/D-chiro-inositol 1-dehydrogenase
MVSDEIKNLGDVDTTMISLKFSNGAVGCINNSRKAAYGFDQRIEVFGSKGMISTNNILQTCVEIKDELGGHTDRNLYFFNERYPESFLKEIVYFVDAVKNDRPVPVSGVDAKISALLAMAAKESYEKCIPIKVDYSSLAKYNE